MSGPALSGPTILLPRRCCNTELMIQQDEWRHRRTAVRLSLAFGVAIYVLFTIFLDVRNSSVASAAPSHIRTCTYKQLEVAAGWGPGGFAGNLGIPLVIVNMGKSACSLEGHPHLALFTEAVNKTPIEVSTDVGGGVYGPVRPRLVVILPDSVASFGVDYVDAMNQRDSNGPTCTAEQLNVALPVRDNPLDQSYGISVNFNVCYSGFRIAVTSIESGPRSRVD